MFFGLCLALATPLFGGAGLDGRIIGLPPRTAEREFASSFERPTRPELTPASGAESMQLSRGCASYETPYWAYGPRVAFLSSAESGSFVAPYSIIFKIPGLAPGQYKRQELPDTKRNEMTFRPKPPGGGVMRFGAAALGFGILVANQITGKRTALGNERPPSLRLKPVLWKNTIGLKAEF